MSVPSFDDVPDDFMSTNPDGTPQQRNPAQDPYLHPIAVIFHLLFKVLAVTVYLVLTLVLGSWDNIFIVTFIVVILLQAADFWTTKNVSGRLLVGLRWWNQIKDDGSSVWQFESRADRTTIHKGEWTVFWVGLGVFTAFWAAAFLKNLITLSPNWIIVDIMGLALCGANLGGYLKCANAARSLGRAASQYAVSYAVGEAAGRFTGGSGSSAPAQSSSGGLDFNATL